jgi:hypothetical protein
LYYTMSYAVCRTISGEKRSATGTLTRTIVWSLLETCTPHAKRALDGWIDPVRQPVVTPIRTAPPAAFRLTASVGSSHYDRQRLEQRREVALFYA